MAITPIRKKAKKRRFIAYDLEWVPRSLDIRVVGAYDGDHFRWFPCMADFLNWALSSEHRGAWFYAHAGGLYDVQFVLEYLIEHGDGRYEVDAKFSGSSAIIVKVKRGKNCWWFLDSFWLLRAKLRDLGKMIGLEKGGVDPLSGASEEEIEAYYRDTALGELIEYNERDCEILWHAIDEFEERLRALGGELQMTLASSAMKLFRRRFLKRPIKTNDAINEQARGAYIASRVEVFQRSCTDANYYDINSSFPFAMLSHAPGNLKSIRRTVPDSSDLYIAKARITVPESYVPPLAYRAEQSRRIYFPTGSWGGYFSSIDLQLLEDTGGTIERIEEVSVFDPFDDMAEYASTLYELRRASSDEAERMILKLLLNSLYGKTAEQSEKTSLHINPSEGFFKATTEEPGRAVNGRGLRELVMPGVWLCRKEQHVAHAHVPIAMHITAIARRNLYRYLADSRAVYYCDTDGFACSLDTELPTGDALGALKLEKVIREATFLAPKQYTMLTTEGKRLVKGKGFPGITYDDFLKLQDGAEVEIRRMMRIRENFRRGSTRPEERSYEKRMRNVVKQKRHFFADGDSRPWDVSELKDE